MRWIIQQWIAVDPSKRGYWYECRRITASTLEEARKKAFPPYGQLPHGYRITAAS